MFKKLFNYNFLYLLLFIIFIPGIFLAATFLFGKEILPKKFDPSYNLIGVTSNNEDNDLQFDLNHINNHSAQKFIENWIGENIPLRSFFIRLNNQFYFSLFKKSYSENGGLIIGKHHQLITDHYITRYCQFYTEDPPENDPLWADKIKQMSDYFESQGKTFIYMITPSKAEYMPNAIPDRFHCKNKLISEHVRRMMELLKERHVLTIDGPKLMVQATKKYKIPMFNLGGIHWNEVAEALALNLIIKQVQLDHHFNLPPIHFTFKLKKAFGTSTDLMLLMNLMYPNFNYLVPEVTFTNHPKIKDPISISLIGGSFAENLFGILWKSHYFSNITYYRYLKLDKTEANNKSIKTSSVDLNKFIEEIKSSNIIVLEENSEYFFASNHGNLLYDLIFESKTGIKKDWS